MRPYAAADIAVILTVVLVALMTWACLCDSNAVASWKPFVCVSAVALLALAALPRHPAS